MISSSPSRSSQEGDRGTALRRYGILDTGPDERFDPLVDLAAHVFDVPTAVISFVDADREWMKARRNFDRRVLPREVSFGTHVVESGELLVVEDAKDDVRFVENPLVTGIFGLRFYAGAPVTTPDGYQIGTIAVMDTEPQSPDTEMRRQLRTLASLVMRELEASDFNSRQPDELELLLAAAQGNSVVLDRDGTILRANENWRDFARAHDVEEESEVAEGKNYLDVCTLPPDDPNHDFGRRAREGIQAVLRGEEMTFDMVYPCHAPDWDRWYHMQVLALDHPQACALVSHVNITDLKQHERQQRVLETAVEQANEMVIMTEGRLEEPGPRITYVNPAFTEITGYEAQEVIGKTPRILQGPATESWVLDDLREALEQGESFEGEVINYRKDGTPFVNQWSVAPVHDDTGTITHWVSVQRDVTEERQLGMRLLRAQKEERRRIGKEIHDEVGGLLASLQMFLALLWEEKEEVPPELEDLEQTVTMLSNVVRTLTAELHSRVLDDYGLSEAVRHIADHLEQRESITIDVRDEIHSDDPLPPLLEHVAYRGIREALDNVIEHAQTDHAQVLLRREEQTLRAHVIDGGIGFDADTAAPTADEYGLDRIQERVERLSGTLAVQSAPGEGTRVTMTLPIPPVSLFEE